jgi:hypothetical protein
MARSVMEGQYGTPVRIVAFNTAAGWSHDATEEIARELRQRCSDEDRLPRSLEAFLAHHGAVKSWRPNTRRASVSTIGNVINQLSGSIGPPKDARMSGFLAKGYFDDTQTSGKVWGIGGYVGGHLHWDHFDAMWPMILSTHEVPYFHMREMADPNGVFSKWHPPA